MHSLRAVSALELVPLGKVMWQELERGFAHTETRFETVKFLSSSLGLEISYNILSECDFIPAGLESN